LAFLNEISKDEGGLMRTTHNVAVRFSYLWSAVCICLLFCPALAQEAQPAAQTKPVEPEAMGLVYLLDSSDHTLKPLPKDAAKVVTHHKGFTGAKGDIQIPGTASSFRLKSGTDLEFIVKCTNPESYEMFQFNPKGKNREAEVSNAKAKFFGGISVQRVGRMTFTVSKYGESSYRFALTAPEPGEYGIVTGWSVFHFGVDPKEAGH
jgi:hypothetical protein